MDTKEIKESLSSSRAGRNILELKSLHIIPDGINSIEDAHNHPELNGFELKEEYFEMVFAPEQLVDNIEYYHLYSSYQSTVKVSDIKGTMHSSYYGNNWLTMLMSLHRHRHDTDIERVTSEIFNPSSGSAIDLRKYNQLYFIAGDGNHRVCQAKFLGIESINCMVNEFVFNQEAYSLTNRIIALKESVPSFEYSPQYRSIDSSIFIIFQEQPIFLRFCDADVSILEDIFNNARRASRCYLKVLYYKVLSLFETKQNGYRISDKNCHESLYRFILTNLSRSNAFK